MDEVTSGDMYEFDDAWRLVIDKIVDKQVNFYCRYVDQDKHLPPEWRYYKTWPHCTIGYKKDFDEGGTFYKFKINGSALTYECRLDDSLFEID